jgi:alkylated DNA nucleotide flippase Atl1
MSQKERDRLKVIEQVAQGRLTQEKAGDLLGLSARQVRRILRRYQKEEDIGLIHRSRGRPSKRKVPAAVRREAVEALTRKEWRDFGPTFAAEKLAEREGIVVSRETVRKWMIQEELWKPRQRKPTHRQWRGRKECTGEMVQMDTSEHDWFEGRGDEAVLIGMIDDASSQVLMRFFPGDNTESNMTMLDRYIRRHGRPLSIYADKASHFTVNRPASIEEQLEGIGPQTQIGRALAQLDIEYIPAHSPQAKGRVERVFGTMQDRLVKELRLADISTIEAANEFLEQTFLPFYNEGFTAEPACPVDAHRSIGDHDLDAIFSHQEERVVANDYTIQYHHTRYQIARESIKARLRGNKVIVERRLDETIKVRYRGEYLQFRPLPEQPKPKRDEQEAGRSKRRSQQPREGHKPAEHHPWRGSHKGTGPRPASP